MSLQQNLAEIENILAVLKQQSISTSNNWNDPVQVKFYEQFIDSLPNEVINYIKSLDNLNKEFESTERIINDLK